jgi:hypothetical protein
VWCTELTAIADEGRALLLVEWACYGAFLQELITVQIFLAPDLNESGVESTERQGQERRQLVLSANRPLPEALRRFEVPS